MAREAVPVDGDTTPLGEAPGRDVPDWDDAFAWAAGSDEWVPVVLGIGLHKDIEIKLTVLLDAGIPACLKARPWGDMQRWQFLTGYEYAMPVLVPPSRLDEARSVLAAPFEDTGDFATAGPELAAMRGGRTWPAQVPRWFRGYAFVHLATYAAQVPFAFLFSYLR